MIDTDKANALDWLNEIVINPDGWRVYYSDSETKACAEAALALLKAQEPRMLTLEELEQIYTAKKTHVWPFNSPPYMWLTVNPDVPLKTGYWICWHDIRDCLENNHMAYLPENYGKVWRIWTAKPTDEQIRTVKWE